MILSDILRRNGCALIAAAAVLSASCATDVTRTGKSPAYLVIDKLATTAGNAQLDSDVRNVVAGVPTINPDNGVANISAVMKNTSATAPTPVNAITISRYHVAFRRSDGRNTPGVDVPYAFDGAATVTIQGGGSGAVSFEIVRRTMKAEPPLSNLVGGGGANIISTIADITFYGQDQAGNEVSVMGTMTVNFADFAG